MILLFLCVVFLCTIIIGVPLVWAILISALLPMWVFGRGGPLESVFLNYIAGISGSAIADTAAIGSVMVPAMANQGYKKPFAAALVAAAGTIGIIIPPSIPMLIYGFVGNVSVT